MVTPARRVLIVDDDAVSRVLLNHMLGAQGFEVTECVAVDPAVELLATEKFDLVICDYLMPDRNGLDLLDELAGHDTPFLLLTGALDRDDLSDDRVGGVSAYLTKPVSTDDLRAVVAHLLEASPAAAETSLSAPA